MTAVGRRQGVILSGGGAKGAYEVGVLKALFEGESPATNYAPFDPDVVTGNSIGAFNAALLLSRLDDDGPAAAVAYLEHVWTELIPCDRTEDRNRVFRYRLNPLDFVTGYAWLDAPERLNEAGHDLRYLFDESVRRGLNFLVSGGDLEERLLQLADFSAFISRESSDRLVRDTIDYARIRASRRALRIVATNWKTGDAKVFANDDMTDEDGAGVILASSALPGIFPCVALRGDPYVDGGLVMNTPLHPAIEAGAETLHVLYHDPDVGRIPLQRLASVLETLDRVSAVEFAVKTNEDLATAKWINDGLTVLERAASGEEVSDEQTREFVRVAARIHERLRTSRPYRKLEIHRYHPRDDVGGALGVLRFDRDRVARLIERGYGDALTHDCDKSGCLIP